MRFEVAAYWAAGGMACPHHNAAAMNLAECIALLRTRKTIPDMCRVASTTQRPTASKKDVQAAFATLPGLLGSNDHKAAVSLVLALVLQDADALIAKLRRQGLLRASRYGFNAGGIKKAAAAALELATLLNVKPARLDYLRSVLALLDMAPAARQLQGSIIERLKRRRGTSIKTLFAVVDSIFAKEWAGNREHPTTSWTFWSATELASAFSRLYMLTRDEFGIQHDVFHFTDDAASGDYETTYAGLLADAAALNELVDAEVMLDGLPYRADRTADGVLVSAIDFAFERSVRLGYIQSEMQYAYRAGMTHEIHSRDPKVQSFDEAIGMLLDGGLLEFVKLKDDPIQRVVFELPMVPALFSLLRSERMFIEETHLVQGAYLDNFHPLGSGDLQISTTLKAMDLFRIQRLFKLFQIAIDRRLASIDDPVRRYKLRLRSTIIVMKRQKLLELLSSILSPEQSSELLGYTTLGSNSSARGSDDYVDLQYRPFVQDANAEGEVVAFSPSVVSKSNFVRSVQYASEHRKKTSADRDPMQVAVVGALNDAGFLTRDSFEFNIDGRRETDIFAYRDGALFIFECKNAYHPCSPHELRNSFDLLEKSQAQLDIRASWLSSPDHQARLFSALSWAVPPAAQVCTCTVTANRIFAGYRLGGHPVRQAHELINVLTRGEIGRGLDAESLRFWRSEKFHVDDLVDYLSDQSVMALHHAAMLPAVRSIAIMEKKLQFAQFGMDLEKAADAMVQAFGKSGPDREVGGDPDEG